MEQDFDQLQANFLKELKTGTSASHTALESNPLSETLLKPSVTKTHYQAYLSALYGAVVACERDVFPLLTKLIPDLDKRRKSSSLRQDLLATDMSDEDIRQLPIASFEHLNEARALGTMYVLEGSTLGGRIIYKHIHEILGLTREHGASYFAGYGSETGPMWKSFIAALANGVITNGYGRETIDAATETFTMIDELLTRAEAATYED